MKEFVNANPRGKHGSHDYDLEQYGITEDRVKDRLKDYIARFEL